MSSSGPKLFVAGADRESSGFDVKNPNTGKIVWQCPSATEKDVDDAITGLAAYQPTWEKVAPSHKRRIFLKAAELLGSPKYADKLKEALSQEIDATEVWQRINILGSVGVLQDAAAQCSMIRGEMHKSEHPNVRMFLVERRAAGVVFAIAPWNAPVNLALRAIAIPLICGNTVLLKSSEHSPACQRIVVDVLLEAGLPPQALSYVCFSRANAPALTARAIARYEVQRVNFTGSDVVGRHIAAECGRHLKPCVMELGGKNPAVVSENARDNLKAAARGIVFGGMINSGQVCMSTERVLVHRSIIEEFETEIAELVKDLRSGDTGKKELGALFTPGAASNVVGMIANAVDNGAKLVVGNAVKEAEGSMKTIVQPVVLSNVTSKMQIWGREAFGPLLSLTPFDTLDEAIRMANDSEYSLIASFWTDNLHEATEYAPQIRAGSVQVNGATIHIEPTFGNAGLGGASGYGRFTVDAFTDLRSIAIHGPNEQYPSL